MPRIDDVSIAIKDVVANGRKCANAIKHVTVKKASFILAGCVASLRREECATGAIKLN